MNLDEILKMRLRVDLDKQPKLNKGDLIIKLNIRIREQVTREILYTWEDHSIPNEVGENLNLTQANLKEYEL